MTAPVRLLLVTLLALVPASARADDPLAKKLDAVMDGKDYKQARWGVLVTDAKTGEVLYQREPDKLFTPASTTKLFSCAAALIAYGPDHRFETPVYRRGPVVDGSLHGDLILVASGDLTFGGRTGPDGKPAFADVDHTYANSGLGVAELTDTDPLAGLKELAKQVRKAGIKEVRGEVLVDDRLFTRSEGTGSGPAAVTPIMVNDNVVDVCVTPGAKSGEPATVTMRPETGYFQMDAVVTTGNPDAEPSLTLQTVGPNQFTVRGKVPAGGKPVVRIYPVDDPATFARYLFIEQLREEGVRVHAPLARPNKYDYPEPDGYEKLTKVAAFKSPPFRETILVTLKVSHNLYASALPCLVAAKKGKKSLEDGLKEQRKVLRDLGLDVESISFGGGAGGSPADCVTPRAAVKLLSAMAKRSEWEAYRAGLPSLGVDGTLAKVVDEDSPARGKAFGKTGTWIWQDAMNGRFLLRSKALAGVMTTKGGRELYYAFYVNDVPLPAGVTATREGKVLGKLCEIIYAGDEKRTTGDE
jgi:D-alanyl-D-alanine carboxypeptidase/D-alanyl-D-alanine-endopeptidase (penicillin-binding protein 4)